MATRRMITSSIWTDEWFGELPPEEMLIWIGLFSRMADDQGRLRDSPLLLRANLFPFREDITSQQVDEALQRFEADGRIRRYTVDGRALIQLLGWWEHQHRQWAQPSELPPPEGWEDRVRTRINGEYVTEGQSPSRARKPRKNAGKSGGSQGKSSAERFSSGGKVSRADPDPDPNPDPPVHKGQVREGEEDAPLKSASPTPSREYKARTVEVNVAPGQVRLEELEEQWWREHPETSRTCLADRDTAGAWAHQRLFDERVGAT